MNSVLEPHRNNAYTGRKQKLNLLMPIMNRIDMFGMGFLYSTLNHCPTLSLTNGDQDSSTACEPSSLIPVKYVATKKGKTLFKILFRLLQTVCLLLLLLLLLFSGMWRQFGGETWRASSFSSSFGVYRVIRWIKIHTS